MALLAVMPLTRCLSVLFCSDRYKRAMFSRVFFLRNSFLGACIPGIFHRVLGSETSIHCDTFSIALCMNSLKIVYGSGLLFPSARLLIVAHRHSTSCSNLAFAVGFFEVSQTDTSLVRAHWTFCGKWKFRNSEI